MPATRGTAVGRCLRATRGRRGDEREEGMMSDERRTRLTGRCDVDGASREAVVDARLAWVGSEAVGVRSRVEARLPERPRDTRVRTSE